MQRKTARFIELPAASHQMAITIGYRLACTAQHSKVRGVGARKKNKYDFLCAFLQRKVDFDIPVCQKTEGSLLQSNISQQDETVIK